MLFLRRKFFFVLALLSFFLILQFMSRQWFVYQTTTAHWTKFYMNFKNLKFHYRISTPHLYDETDNVDRHNLCRNTTTVFVIVLVRPTGYALRDVIRRSWLAEIVCSSLLLILLSKLKQY